MEPHTAVMTPHHADAPPGPLLGPGLRPPVTHRPPPSPAGLPGPTSPTPCQGGQVPTSALPSTRGRGRHVDTKSPRVITNQLPVPRSALRPHQSPPSVPPTPPLYPQPFPVLPIASLRPPPLRCSSPTRPRLRQVPLGPSPRFGPPAAALAASPTCPARCRRRPAVTGCVSRRLRRAAAAAGAGQRGGSASRRRPLPAGTRTGSGSATRHRAGARGGGTERGGPRAGAAVTRVGRGHREGRGHGRGYPGGAGAALPGPPGREEALFPRLFPSGSTWPPVPAEGPSSMFAEQGWNDAVELLPRGAPGGPGPAGKRGMRGRPPGPVPGVWKLPGPAVRRAPGRGRGGCPEPAGTARRRESGPGSEERPVGRGPRRESSRLIPTSPGKLGSARTQVPGRLQDPAGRREPPPRPDPSLRCPQTARLSRRGSPGSWRG